MGVKSAITSPDEKSGTIKPLKSGEAGFSRLNNSDDSTTGVRSAIGENFIERDRLDGVMSDVNMNKRLRKSIANPTFKALVNDPLAIRKLPGSSSTLYDVRGKNAERSKKITSYYFGNEEGESIVNEEISLKSTFGEDRNRILPDQLGTKAIFIRAQKVNLDDPSDNTAEVQVGINVSEL